MCVSGIQWKIKCAHDTLIHSIWELYSFYICLRLLKENLNDENVLQVSTDGLNVIKKFVKKLSEKIMT